jgi:diguanylate cyclase (GGDEF)-like protein
VIDIRLVSNSSHLRKDLAAFLESNAVLRQLFSLDTGNFDEIPPEAVVVIVLDLVHREDYSDALLFSLQSLPPDRRVPAIAIVAEGTPSTEIARIIESGANDCVQLPLCHQELLARVKIHGGYMEYIRQQERVLEKNRQASSLAPAAPNAADLRLLEDEIAALKAENRELADKVDNALQDKAALEAIINTIAEHGSIVENQMDNELQAAKYQAGHDPLTQLYNRLSFNSFVQQDLEKVSTTNAPLSLIMFDIDHFKRVNDSFGHEKGDQVLVAITVCVKKILPELCLFSRWGGEEFMILSPDFTVTQAQDLAEYLRISVERMKVDGIDRVTCSFGVTEYRKGENLEEFVGRVDKAMYAAKQGGRNRVQAE